VDVLGKHLSIFYPREDVADRKPARELAIVRETGRYEERSAFLRRDGSPYVANVVVTRLDDESCGIREFAKVIRDVAERVAEE
jgi:two-component system sensor kinase FixL